MRCEYPHFLESAKVWYNLREKRLRLRARVRLPSRSRSEFCQGTIYNNLKSLRLQWIRCNSSSMTDRLQAVDLLNLTKEWTETWQVPVGATICSTRVCDQRYLRIFQPECLLLRAKFVWIIITAHRSLYFVHVPTSPNLRQTRIRRMV